MGHHARMTTGERGGRPAVTSAQDLSEVALRLFVEHGYDETSVDDVAAAAGIGRRTFFRYFPAKADALFAASPDDLRRLSDALAAADPGEPVRAVVRHAVLSALAVPPGEEEWVRRRALLVLTVPALRAHGHTTFDAWRAAVAGFTAQRLGVPLEDVVPVAVGHAALAASLTAHEHWLSTPGGALADSLAAALDLLLPDV